MALVAIDLRRDWCMPHKRKEVKKSERKSRGEALREGLNLKDIAPWRRARAVEEFLSRRDGEKCAETLQKVCNPVERSRQIEEAKGLSWLHPDYRADGESGGASASSGPVDGGRERQPAIENIAAGAGASKRGRLPSVGRKSSCRSSFTPDWTGNSSGGSVGRPNPNAEESEEESVGYEDSW